MNLIEAQELIEAGYENALQLQNRPKCPNPQCEAFWDWHKNGFCLKNFGCSLTQEEVLASPRQKAVQAKEMLAFHPGTFDAPHYTASGIFAPWSDLSVFELAEMELDLAQMESDFATEMTLVRLKIAKQRLTLERVRDMNEECVCGHRREDHCIVPNSFCTAIDSCECDTFRSVEDASSTAWMEGCVTL